MHDRQSMPMSREQYLALRAKEESPKPKDVCGTVDLTGFFAMRALKRTDDYYHTVNLYTRQRPFI